MFIISSLALAPVAAGFCLFGCGDNVWPDKPADLNTPLGIRLGLASPTSMNVGWSTFQKPSEVCVSYGLTPQMNQVACANESNIYDTSRLWFSSVELTNLQPGKQYYYQIHSTNSTVYSFTSGLQPGDKSPFSFAIAADMGLYGPDGYQDAQGGNDPDDYHISARRLSIMADEDNVHLVVHPGDFAYADDAVLNPNDLAHGGIAVYEALLEQFYTQLSQVSRKVAYMVGPGNHEASCLEIPLTNLVCPQGQNNFTDYRYRHGGVMPQGFASASKNETAQKLREKANSLALSPMWYSFDYGSVHYVMINTETDFDNAPDQVWSTSLESPLLAEGPFGQNDQQLQWLEADLASVDRTVTPWIIVSGHRPWYTSAPDSDGCSVCKDAFEEILYKYSVDIVFTGHVHNSQRFLPMYKGTPDSQKYNNPLAPTYVVAGGAGNIEGLTAVSSSADDNLGLEWSNDQVEAVVRVDVQSSQDVKVTFVRSSDGNELDTFTLHREHNAAFMTNA